MEENAVQKKGVADLKPDREARIAFERARLDYCLSAFRMQQDDADRLERRAKFFLSFVTIFLGSIFLKLDLLKDLLTVPLGNGTPLWLIFSVCAFLGILALFLLAALFALVALAVSMRLRKVNSPYPYPIADSLFAPNSKYLDKRDEPTFLYKVALNYAVALDENLAVNKTKARWIEVAFVCVICAVCSFGVFLLLVCAYYVQA